MRLPEKVALFISILRLARREHDGVGDVRHEAVRGEHHPRDAVDGLQHRATALEAGQETASLGVLRALAPARERYLPPDPERPGRYVGRRGLADARRAERDVHVRVAKLEGGPETRGEPRDGELAQLPGRLPRPRIVRGEALAGGVEHHTGSVAEHALHRAVVEDDASPQLGRAILGFRALRGVDDRYPRPRGNPVVVRTH